MPEQARNLTTDEYLAWSRTAELKHEWVNGELVAMSGGTPAHAAIGGNLIGMLFAALRGGPCRPTTSDQRLHVEATDAWFYPDVQVICGPYQLARDGLSITNPVAIVELLSPSTRAYDLGAKWSHYLRIPSLQSYLLVDPERRSVLQYARNAAGWQLTEHTEGDVVVPALSVALPLDDIFGGLDAIPA